MDIVTHGMIGMVLAAPLAERHPVVAASVALGSVLPDLDALSRLAGKRAFLAVHQTASHSLVAAVGMGAVWAGVLTAFGMPGLLAGVGLALATVLHSLVDLSNTYGVVLLWPFVRRRRSLEWVFFVDAVVLALTVPALVAVLVPISRTRAPASGITALWLGALAVYFGLKRTLRRRVQRLGPAHAASYVPSALWPWRFYGYVPGDDAVQLFSINAFNGQQRDAVSIPIHDVGYRRDMARVPEFERMVQLSPAYHVVTVQPRGDSVEVTCRDLRTRNFGGSFGELRATLDAAGKATGVVLNV